MNTGKAHLRVVTFSLLLSVSAPAIAADWDGETSTDWFDATNWVSDTAPAPGFPVYIDTVDPNPTIVSGGSTPSVRGITVGDHSTGMLTIENGGSVRSLYVEIGFIEGANGTVVVSGTDSLLDVTRHIGVGWSGTGALVIQDGGTVETTDSYLGSEEPAVGTVTVTGENSLWYHSGILYIGLYGKGIVSIEDGGSVVSQISTVGYDPNSDSKVTVTGANSTWINNGTLDVGAGLITVSDGGTLSSVDLSLGWSGTDSSGAVVVTDADSLLVAENLYVGDEGNGSLTIENGAEINTGLGQIGVSAGSHGTVLVTGSGSVWSSSGNVNVGQNGNGMMTIEAGGKVDSLTGRLGFLTGSEGTVTVSGENSAWTNTGSLYIAMYGNGTLTIEDGGSVSNYRGYMGFYSGSDSRVTVTGANSTWTNNDNLGVGLSGTALLSITDGASVSSIQGVIGSNPGSSGTVTIADEGSTWFSASTVHIGYAGAGILNIGAAAGETAVAPGTLDANTVQFGKDDPAENAFGTLVFNHTDANGDYEFASNMSSGDGVTAVIEHYSGFTLLTGDSSGFSHTTNILGGVLAIENMLGGVVNVMDGGTLGGSGAATGDVNFADGSIYLVNMDGSTQDHGLTVYGSASLDGMTRLTGDYASIVGMGQVAILTTKTPLSGQFDGVTASSVFLTPELSYDADGSGDDHVYVSIEQTTAFADVAVTSNQRSVGNALDTLLPGSPLYTAVALMDSAENARDAYDQLSGEIHASLQGAIVENSQNIVRAVNDRIHNALEPAAENTSVAAYGDTVDSPGGFWITGYGDWMTTDATGAAHEMESDLYGVVAGLDSRFGDYGRLGVLGGYAHTGAAVDALASEAEADSYTLGVYGGADNGSAVLSLGALYTWHSVDSTRAVTNPVADMLQADYDARSWQFFAEAGYRVTSDAVTFEPFAGVSYINLQTDSYRETGGLAALSSSSQSTSTTFTTIGMRLSAEVGDVTTLRGLAGWRHAFGDVDPASTFSVSGSAPFSVIGAPIAEDAAVVEAGVDFAASDNITVGASYEGQFGDGAIANGFNARLRAQF